jgi:LytS/YehU family sensor histidine kinase
MNNTLTNLPKYFIGFIGTFIFRLLSPFFGLWNISPLMATGFAGGKAFGPWAGALYIAISMILIDLVMGRVGIWTIVTSITYGLVGFLGGMYLKNKKANAKNFVIISIIGTLIFDIITGVLMGPLMFGGSFLASAIGQVPFTLRHLAGNVFFAVVLAPWFYRKIMTNPKLEFNKLFKLA